MNCETNIIFARYSYNANIPPNTWPIYRVNIIIMEHEFIASISCFSNVLDIISYKTGPSGIQKCFDNLMKAVNRLYTEIAVVIFYISGYITEVLGKDLFTSESVTNYTQSCSYVYLPMNYLSMINVKNESNEFSEALLYIDNYSKKSKQYIFFYESHQTDYPSVNRCIVSIETMLHTKDNTYVVEVSDSKTILSTGNEDYMDIGFPWNKYCDKRNFMSDIIKEAIDYYSAKCIVFIFTMNDDLNKEDLDYIRKKYEKLKIVDLQVPFEVKCELIVKTNSILKNTMFNLSYETHDFINSANKLLLVD